MFVRLQVQVVPPWNNHPLHIHNWQNRAMPTRSDPMSNAVGCPIEYRLKEELNVTKAQSKFALILRRLLCQLGRHGFDVMDVVMGFGTGGNVETVKCRHCGLVVTRQG